MGASRKHVAEEDQGRQRDQTARQGGHPRQSPGAVDEGHEHIGKPLPSEPGGSAARKGKQVRDRYATVLENPFSGADVPARVAVGQKRRPSLAGDEQPADHGGKQQVAERGPHSPAQKVGYLAVVHKPPPSLSAGRTALWMGHGTI